MIENIITQRYQRELQQIMQDLFGTTERRLRSQDELWDQYVNNQQVTNISDLIKNEETPRIYRVRALIILLVPDLAFLPFWWHEREGNCLPKKTEIIDIFRTLDEETRLFACRLLRLGSAIASELSDSALLKRYAKYINTILANYSGDDKIKKELLTPYELKQDRDNNNANVYFLPIVQKKPTTQVKRMYYG